MSNLTLDPGKAPAHHLLAWLLTLNAALVPAKANAHECTLALDPGKALARLLLAWLLTLH